jgi:hypothetical protein
MLPPEPITYVNVFHSFIKMACPHVLAWAVEKKLGPELMEAQ